MSEERNDDLPDVRWAACGAHTAGCVALLARPPQAGRSGTIDANNRGGEDHTFTEVATFGGGCIGILNGLLGLTPVAECAGFPGGAFGATLVPTRGTIEKAALSPGTHRFECLIHPWMQAKLKVVK